MREATYRGTVYPWQCDHVGHMNIMWYVGKFDEANWNLFARLGPTEFALATPNARDGRQLALLAQRLRDQLNETSQPPLTDTPIGASIGIAFFPEDANDSAGMMAAANAAMYAARRAGRNHVAFNALAA